MVRIALLSLLLLFMCACQKNTYELSNSKKPAKAPEYDSALDINQPGNK